VRRRQGTPIKAMTAHRQHHIASLKIFDIRADFLDVEHRRITRPRRKFFALIRIAQLGAD
jgi:hypothetical protein